MPCSMERTPARTAALMPSLPWAWAITQRPAAAASVTGADRSSSRKWAWRGSSVGDRTPPLVATLMTSAPARTSSRTLRRMASGPSTRPSGVAGGAGRAHARGPADQAVGHAGVDRPEVELLSGREPAVAVAAGLGQQGQRDLQPRPLDEPVFDRPLDPGVGPGRVPRGRDAGGQGGRQVPGGLVEAVGERLLEDAH